MKLVKTFGTLDAMRGCAALAVVLTHAHFLFGWSAHINAHLAVDLFFGLSGFVLCHAYRQRFKDGLKAHEFLRNRLIRLYPLYLASIAIALLPLSIEVQKGAITLSRAISIVLSEIFLIPSVELGVRREAFFLNYPAWSLLFELFVNIVFINIWKTLTLTLRRLAGLYLVFGLMMIVVVMFNHGTSAGWSLITMPAGIIRVIFSFFLGVLVYEYDMPRLGRHVKLQSNFLSAGLTVLLFLLLVFAPSGRFCDAVDLLSIFVIFPVLIHIGARQQPTGWWASVSAALGGATYAVFAIHVPLLNLLANMMASHAVHPSTSLGVGFLIGVALLAVLLDAFYDRPMRAWLSARLRGSRHAPYPPLGQSRSTMLTSSSSVNPLNGNI